MLWKVLTEYFLFQVNNDYLDSRSFHLWSVIYLINNYISTQVTLVFVSPLPEWALRFQKKMVVCYTEYLKPFVTGNILMFSKIWNLWSQHCLYITICFKIFRWELLNNRLLLLLLNIWLYESHSKIPSIQSVSNSHQMIKKYVLTVNANSYPFTTGNTM